MLWRQVEVSRLIKNSVVCYPEAGREDYRLMKQTLTSGAIIFPP